MKLSVQTNDACLRGPVTWNVDAWFSSAIA